MEEVKQAGDILEDMFFEAMQEAGYDCVQSPKGSPMDKEQGTDIVLFTGVYNGVDTMVRLDITANNKRDSLTRSKTPQVPVHGPSASCADFGMSIRIANYHHQFKVPVLVIELDGQMTRHLYNPKYKAFMDNCFRRYMQQLPVAVEWYNMHLSLTKEFY